MQWFKRFFELNYSGEAYDAVQRRARGKGGAKFIGKGAPKKKVTSREKRDQFNNAARSIRTGRTSRATAAGSDAGGKSSEGKENERTTTNHGASRVAKAGTTTRHAPMGGRAGGGRLGGAASSAEINNNLRGQVRTLTDDNVALKKQNAEQQLTIDGLEKERDFYLGKLRDIEILLQSVEEDHGAFSTKPQGPEATLKDLVERGLKILYATEGEDFVAVQDLAEEEDDAEEDIMEEEDKDLQQPDELPAPPLAEVDSAEVAVPVPEQKDVEEDIGDSEETF